MGVFTLMIFCPTGLQIADEGEQNLTMEFMRMDGLVVLSVTGGVCSFSCNMRTGGSGRGLLFCDADGGKGCFVMEIDRWAKWMEDPDRLDRHIDDDAIVRIVYHWLLSSTNGAFLVISTHRRSPFRRTRTHVQCLLRSYAERVWVLVVPSADLVRCDYSTTSVVAPVLVIVPFERAVLGSSVTLIQLDPLSMVQEVFWEVCS